MNLYQHQQLKKKFELESEMSFELRVREELDQGEYEPFDDYMEMVIQLPTGKCNLKGLN